MATIGIDIGGSKVLAVRVDDGRVVDRYQGRTPKSGEAPTVAALDAARRVWSDDVSAVGVGIAGLVRWPEGSFAWGPHVPATDIPVRSELEAELGVPVVVDNDANATAWCEMQLGTGVGYRHALVVTLGTGIGGAVVIDGEIFRGGSFAGEWGHMQYDPGGTLCDCGKRGCWETVASGPALVRLAKEVMALNPDSSFAYRLADVEITGEAITAAADSGDEVARGLVAQVGAEFGRGVASLVAIFDPDVVIVGGGLGSVGESLVGPARRVVADALHGGAYRLPPPILVAARGSDAGAEGAARMAQDLVDDRIRLE
jgi:glucokinase